MTPMNLKRLLLFKIYVLTECARCRIYGVHDEAKDKAFELELSWIYDELKRQHEKVLWDIHMKNGLCMFLHLNLKLNFFVDLSYRFQMTYWSRPKLLLRQLLRRWMLTKKHNDMPKLHVWVLLKYLIPLG